MAFDSAMVHAVVFVLSQLLINARVDKIHQPEKDEVHLLLRNNGENYRLVISSSANNSRIHLSTIQKENPPVPYNFCILLRKQLSGGRIASISQLGFERVVVITVESKNEMGYPQIRRIYAEIMGKYSNIMLTDEEDKILGVIKPVDFTTSQKRQVLPGMRYEMPPPQDKISPLEETKENFLKLYGEVYPVSSVEKYIISRYQGLSRLSAGEIAYRSRANDPISLWESFAAFIGIIKNSDITPVVIFDENKKPIEYSFTLVEQYGSGYECVTYQSVSEAIETFFRYRDNIDHTKQRAADLFKTINNIKNRLNRKTVLQKDELERAGKKDEYKLYGDLINANIYALRRGMDRAIVVNYYEEGCPEIEIPLDIRLTPAQNAQMYFKKYVKARNASVILEKQIEESARELQYIESVLDSLLRAKGQSELDEIRTELEHSGYLGRSAKGKKKPLPYKLQTKPAEYRTSGGYRVLCGKNNLQNDMLTFKIASKLDWWFHVKNAPGSHVVMFCGGEEPSEKDFTEAAMIAAVNSSLSDGKHIAVDYTEVKNIKKPSGANPGYVIYHTNYSAYVNSDAEYVEKLRVEKNT